MVGIIPKPLKKTSKLYEVAPYVVFGLVAVIVLAYVALIYLENKNLKTLAGLQDRIAQVGTKDERALETQVLLDKQKIDDFSKLLANHQRASNFFKFLEESCHPEVWFNKLELNVKDAQVTLSGETASFETLGQQIVILRNQEAVKSIEISDPAVEKDGQVSFTFSISLDPKIFKNNE